MLNKTIHPLIGFIPPQLATLVDEPPEGAGWLHEIKLDGYRTCLVIDDERSCAFTRRGYNWTAKYWPVVKAARDIKRRNAVLDGEMIVQDEAGRSDFVRLRQAIEGDPHRLVFYVFDLLVLDDQDLRRERLSNRRDILEELIGEHKPDWPLQFSQTFSDGGALLETAARLGLEGIVSKKADSRYRSGRTTTWLKSKVFAEDEFVVIGAEHEPRKPAFALLARERGDHLEYAGSAFVTLAGEDRDRFWNTIERLGRQKPVIPMERKKGRRWVEPRLHVRAQYLGGVDKLRHATIRELIE